MGLLYITSALETGSIKETVMEEKIRLTCSVCQAGIRVRAATKAKFAICPKCQARTPIPERGPVEELGMDVPQDDPIQPEGLEPPTGSDVTQGEPMPAQDLLPEEEVLQGEVPQGEAVPQDEPMIQDPAAVPPIGQEEAPPEEEPEEAPRPRRRLTSPKRGSRRLRRGGGDDDEEGPRLRPKKKGFNPILIVIPIVLIAVGAALYFGGFFESEEKEVLADARKVFKAIQRKNLKTVWDHIDKADTTEEEREKRRIEIQDFFDEVMEFNFDYEIKEYGPGEGYWSTIISFTSTGNYKDKDGKERKVDNSSEDCEIKWAKGKARWIIIDETHKPLFKR
jgi:hypothetical protein